MKKFKLNPDFARRYFFVALLFAGMGGWFGYDGLVTYPKTPAAALFESIEKSAPPPEMSEAQLEAFKRQKIEAQYGFAILCLLAAGLIGAHLWSVARFDLEFDETGFVYRGRRCEFKDVKTVDRSNWEKKDILVVDGIRLDAWHHTGVKELAEKLGHA